MINFLFDGFFKILYGMLRPGRVAEWLKAADCKSADVCLRRFEPSPFHHLM